MFQKSCVRILALYTGWTFFTYVFVIKFVMCLKKMKINVLISGSFLFSNRFTLNKIYSGKHEKSSSFGHPEIIFEILLRCF